MSDPRRFGESKRHEAWDKPGSLTFYHEPSLPVSEDQTEAIAASLEAADSKHVAATIAVLRRFDGRERAMACGTRFRLIDMEDPNLNGYELTCLDTGYATDEDKDQYVKVVIFDHDGVRNFVSVSNCEAVKDHRTHDHRVRDLETLAALALAMEGLNANVLASLARHGAELGLQGEPAQVAAAAREAAAEVERSRPPPKSGAKRLEPRYILFRELAASYEAATSRRGVVSTSSQTKAEKRGLPTGQFYKFLRAAVAPVPSISSLSDYALHQTMRRARKDK